MEIEKTPLPFKEVIRENPELAQGQRRVVSKDKMEKKLTIFKYQELLELLFILNKEKLKIDY